MKNKRQLTSEEVFKLDSFRTLCADIGIDPSMPIKRLTIDLDCEEFANIDMSYMAFSEKEER